MATFHLRIVTPDRLIYDGKAERILLRTVGGDVCILARHIDYVAPLGIGEARMTDAEGRLRIAACNGGVLSVSKGEVCVAATTFEWAEEIDHARAAQAHVRAQAQLSKLQREDVEYCAAEARLARALLRENLSSQA